VVDPDLVDVLVLINCRRAGVRLPPHFDQIQLPIAQRRKLEELGIHYEQRGIRDAREVHHDEDDPEGEAEAAT